VLRFIDWENGLSRQASRITRRSRRAPSQHALERDRLVLDIEIARQHGVGRDQVIDAVDLDAVPGIEEDGDIRVPRDVGEIADGVPHVDDRDVAAILDRIEARLLQQGSESRRIADRVRQPPGVQII
jgi:hypothetical protein